MSEEQKVISFPTRGRTARGAAKSADERMAADVRSAWRRLLRTIRAARTAGLTVQIKCDLIDAPTIERRL